MEIKIYSLRSVVKAINALNSTLKLLVDLYESKMRQEGFSTPPRNLAPEDARVEISYSTDESAAIEEIREELDEENEYLNDLT